MQKITPFLWFDMNCEEAMNLYVSAFPNSKIVSIKRYPEGITEGPVAGMDGKVLTGIIEIDGYKMMMLDGGPVFAHTPANSMSVQCKDEAEIDALHAKLREGGSDLMALGVYPWSKKYAWINDKFGMSWQLNVPNDYSTIKNRFAPTRMFYGANDGKAEEAINYYTSVFPDSKVESTYPNPETKTLSHADYTLMGQSFMALDAGKDGHKFDITGAFSYYVECETQEEINKYWVLSADPASEQCGWLKDKYGFSWQISPKRLGEMMSSSDPEAVKRVMNAFMQMKKYNIADLEKAYNG